MLQQGVVVRRKCHTCSGDGEIERIHCHICGQPLPNDDPWWESDQDVMPCGHSAEIGLMESSECPDCQGAGWVDRWVSVDEWQAMRRRRAVKIAILILALLIPVIALLLAVYEEPDYLCGSWWYGSLIISLVVRRW